MTTQSLCGINVKLRFFFLFLWRTSLKIVMGISLNLLIAIGSTVIFTILIIPIHEHGLSFHLLYLQFLYLEILLQRFFSFSWLGFLSFSFCSCNGECFIDFLSSACLLFIYINASDFCMLILYPATLLEVLRRSKSFQQSHSGLLSIESCYLQLRIL